MKYVAMLNLYVRNKMETFKISISCNKNLENGLKIIIK